MRVKDDREISKVPVGLLPAFLEVEDGPAQAWAENGVRYEIIQIGQPWATEAELISEWLREMELRAIGKIESDLPYPARDLAHQEDEPNLFPTGVCMSDLPDWCSVQ